MPIMCKMQEQEGGQKDVKEEGKEVNLAINGNQKQEIIDGNKPKEVLEGQTKDGQEKGSGDLQTSLKPEEEREEQAEDEGQEKDKTTTEILQEPTREEEREEDQQEKDKDVTDSLKLNPLNDSMAEEQQGQEDNLKPTALIPDPEPPAREENQQEEAAGTEEREVRPSTCPAKVLSAVERFQSPAPSWGFQVKTRAKEMTETRRPCNQLQSRENAHIRLLSDSNTSEENNHSEGHEEEESPSVKVSELKKRFEA